MRVRVLCGLGIVFCAAFGLARAAEALTYCGVAPLQCSNGKVPATLISDLAENQVTGLTSDLSSKANASTLVCGHAISSNVCPTAAEVGADASGAAAAVQSNLDTHTGLTTSAHGGVIPSSANIYADGNIALTTGTSTSTATSAALSAGPKMVLASVPESVLSLGTGTVADVSTTHHGLMPMLPNDNTKFLNGVGSWVAGGGGVSVVTSVVAPDANDGAVFYLDEAYGSTTWVNSGSAAGNLTVQSGTVYAGAPGLRFRTSTYIDAVNVAGLKSTDNKWEYASISVSCWFRPNGTSSSTTYLAYKTYATGLNNDPASSLALSVAHAQVLVGTGPSVYMSAAVGNVRPTLAIGEWHHVAGTFDDSTGTLSYYMDGILQATTTTAGKHIVYGSSHGAWVLGTPTNFGTSPVTYSLQDCRISNIARPLSYWQDMSKRGHTYQPNAVVF